MPIQPSSPRRRESNSQSIPVGVEKGLNSRLFGLSVIPEKEGVGCEMDPRLCGNDGGGMWCWYGF